MLASKHADPDATPSPLSRRKISRASIPPFDQPSPTGKRTDFGLHNGLTATNLALNSGMSYQAQTSILKPTGDATQDPEPDGQHEDAASPLPHVAEIAKSQHLPEPTTVLSRSPSPQVPSVAVTSRSEEHTPTGVLEAGSATASYTLDVATLATSASPDGISRSLSPRAFDIKKLRSPKGKICTVRVPDDLQKTYAGSAQPLTKEEINGRLQAFEAAGYDTRGFRSGIDATGDGHADAEGPQARRIFPDQEEMHLLQEKKDFAISVPVKKEWDDYVDQLREEKLRKLGVSMGDDPVQPSLSRQTTSPYPPLAFSPPPPGSSAASHHQWQNMAPFSAPFSPAASTNNTSLGYMASPPPSSQLSRPGHLSRQSTTNFQFPGNQFPGIQAGSMSSYHWSQQRAFTPESMNRSGSPSRVSITEKPIPKLPNEPASPHGSRTTTPLAEIQTQLPTSHISTVSQSQIADQDPLPAASSSELPSSPPKEGQLIDLASPKPQGHHHNISASLEREVENAQYYPGEYVDEDEEEEGEIPKHQDSSRMDWASLGAERKAAVARPESHHQPGRSLASNASTQLNVEAKEFKFDPAKSLNRNFSMTSDAFMPAAASKTARAADPTSSVSFATAHSTQGSVSLSHFNVAAPEFKPPAQKSFAFSSNWFNFSKKAGEPVKDAADGESKKTEDVKEPQTAGSKIFGGLAEIIKPGKKSKAIPIVNPDAIGVATTKYLSDDEQEDEDGRPTRSDERRKRGRKAELDGDEVPRFAEPIPEPEQHQLAVQNVTAPSLEESKPEISQEELHRHMSEDLNYSNGRRPLQLEYDLDVNADFSDGSNVPWHGVDADQEEDDRRKSLGYDLNTLLAASPAPSTAVDETANEIDDMKARQNLNIPEADNSEQLPYPNEEQSEQEPVLYPHFHGANDIADYINNDNSDFGIERAKSYLQETPRSRSGARARSMSPEPPTAQRDQPSPSLDQFDRNDGASPTRDYSRRWERRNPRDSVSPVRRLNTVLDAPVSDWDDMLSSGAELKIPQQYHLNDRHMAGLVEGLLKRHLAPFDSKLQELSASLASVEARGGPTRSRQRSNFDRTSSDADDESENEGERAPRRDLKSVRRMSQIRAVVQEAVVSAQSSGLVQVEQETKYRKAAEQRADDLQRLLTITEKEIALYKEATANQDDKIRSLEEDRDEALQGYRDVEEELRTKTLDFTSEVAKLENDLDEYRASATKWQGEIDAVKHAREAMQRTIDTMKSDAADHARDRAQLAQKISSLEEALEGEKEEAKTTDNQWRDLNDERNRTLRNLEAKTADATEVKAALEAEVQSLRLKEQEASRNAIRATVTLEETQNARTSLEAQVAKLNDRAVEHSTIVARYEREASEAKETTAIEVQRTKTLMETDIEIANKQVENVRADLETRLEMTKYELENVRKDHNSVRERYERSLNESSVARKEATQEANAHHTKRLQEEREHFDRALSDLSTRHDRAMRNAHEDKQRSQDHLSSQLELSYSKIAHLDGKSKHLEERLSIAQSAAQAAAAAAQAAKSTPTLPAADKSVASSRSIATPAHLEKVSPQALRESIVVLQEQLQDREARIERLEAQTPEVGTGSGDAGTASKVQDKEAEVGWLREILGVRLDDLSDLIGNLQMEKFDRGAARNAAIRIKANLQMEQQERDRQLDPSKRLAASPALPSLTDIQNFASPKAAQLATAWGNWRRNPPTLAGMREQQAASASSRGLPGGRSNTPRPSIGQEMAAGFGRSKPMNPMAAAAASNAGKNKDTDAQSFLSGLMTPPTSNLRRTPSNSAAAKQSNTARPRTPSQNISRQGSSSGSPEKRSRQPGTPELMRKGDYDLDAELGGQEIEEVDEDESEDEDTVSPSKRQNKVEETADATSLEPFGKVVASDA